MIDMLVCATLSERIWNADIWYCIPAIIAISLVYAATRHENLGPILRHALRFGLWIVGVMAVLFLILRLIT